MIEYYFVVPLDLTLEEREHWGLPNTSYWYVPKDTDFGCWLTLKNHNTVIEIPVEAQDIVVKYPYDDQNPRSKT